MKYIGLNKTEITYGSIVHVRRDLCFTLLAPGEFDTHECEARMAVKKKHEKTRQDAHTGL
jgi:hypothetical protein